MANEITMKVYEQGQGTVLNGGGAGTVIDRGASFDIPISGLSVGNHTLEVTATDTAAGKSESTRVSTGQFTIDSSGLTIDSVTNGVSGSGNGTVEISVDSIPNGALVLVMSQSYGVVGTGGCTSPNLTFTRRVVNQDWPGPAAFTAVAGSALTDEVITLVGEYPDMYNSACVIVLTGANTSTFNTATYAVPASAPNYAGALTNCVAGSYVFGNFITGELGDPKVTSAVAVTGTTELQDQYLSAHLLATWVARCTDKPTSSGTVTIQGTADQNFAEDARGVLIEIRAA